MIECGDLSFDGDFDGVGTDGLLTFDPSSTDYTNAVYPPGLYRVTITGTAIGSTNNLQETATFEFELKDVCDPPTSLSLDPPGLQDQSYTVTDDSMPTYTHPNWTIEPSFCTFTYSYDETKLPGD